MKVFKVKRVDFYEVRSAFKHRNPETKVIANPDMIRYDRCYVCEDYPNLIAVLNNHRVTVDRWRSFSQSVHRITEKDIPSKTLDLTKWFTYINGKTFCLDKEYLSERKEFGLPVVVQFSV